MRLWFLGYRGPVHARVRLSGLLGGDSRFQIPQGDGGVQAAGDAVWPGAACVAQGQDGGLQGETPAELDDHNAVCVILWRKKIWIYKLKGALCKNIS